MLEATLRTGLQKYYRRWKEVAQAFRPYRLLMLISTLGLTVEHQVIAKQVASITWSHQFRERYRVLRVRMLWCCQDKYSNWRDSQVCMRLERGALAVWVREILTWITWILSLWEVEIRRKMMPLLEWRLSRWTRISWRPWETDKRKRHKLPT